MPECGYSNASHRRWVTVEVVGVHGMQSSVLAGSGPVEEIARYVYRSGTLGLAVAPEGSCNRVDASLGLDDTKGHAMNALLDWLAFTATKKSVSRILAMLQFSETYFHGTMTVS
ncbi:hypothetical protein ABIE24_000906 [Mycetocola sp. 2940]